jgi:hypothetical protein
MQMRSVTITAHEVDQIHLIRALAAGAGGRDRGAPISRRTVGAKIERPRNSEDVFDP